MSGRGSTRTMATQAILRKANKEIIHAHLGCCVKDAFDQGNEAEKDEKIEEIMAVMDKFSK